MSATAVSARLAVEIEPIDPARDAARLQRWLAHPRSRFWEMADLDVAQVRAYLETIADDARHGGWLGRVDGEAAFYVETYEPDTLLPPDVFRAEPGDIGMHLLIAPPAGDPTTGFTSAVMRGVMRFCLGTAQEGGRLAARLERHLAGAAPAAGWRRALDADREQRQGVRAAVAELCALLGVGQPRVG